MSLKEGWLSKRGAINTSWKKRYVVVTDTGLLYYRKPDTKPLGAIPLSSVVVSTSDSPRDFNLYTAKRVYVFQAGDEEQRDEWVMVIHQVIPPLRLVPPDSLSLRPSPTRSPALPSDPLSLPSSSSPDREKEKDKEKERERGGSSPTEKEGPSGMVVSTSSPSLSRDKDRDRPPLGLDLREGPKSPRTSEGRDTREEAKNKDKDKERERDRDKDKDKDREREWEREEDYKEMAIRLQRAQEDLVSSSSREQALAHQLSLLQSSYDSLLSSSLLKDQELSSLKEHKTVWKAETEALEEKLMIRDNMIKTLREEAEAKSKLLMQHKHSRLSVSPLHSLPSPDPSSSDPSEADKVEKLSRELDKAKEASMANSSHIVFLSGEIQRLEKDNQVLQRLLGTSEDPATKRLVEAEARERQLRTQLDQDSSRHSSLLKDLNDHLSFLKDRYFRSFVVAYKLKAQLGGKTSSVKVAELQERAVLENIDFHNYEDWIKAQLDPTFV